MVEMELIGSDCFEGSSSSANQSAVAWSRPRRLLLSLDILAGAISFCFAGFLVATRLQDHTARLADLVFQALLCAVLFTLLYRARQYSAERRVSRLNDLGSLIKNAVLAFFFTSGAWLASDAFFTGYRGQSRTLAFSGMLVFVGLLAVNRLLMWAYQRRLFARGDGTRNVVVVGHGAAAADFRGFLEKRPWLGIRCTATMPARGDSFSVERIQRMLTSGEISDLVLALDPNERNDFERISKLLAQAGIQFRVVPSLFEESLHASRVHGLRGLSVFNVDIDPLDRVQRTFKRALDFSVSGLVLLGLSPLLLFIALAIKLDSRGPVVFRQVRLGMGGRPFEMLKFRTMVRDAEARLESLRADNEAEGPLFKMKRDPRVTRLGAFLRKWSLDEFLQFVNVFRGEMSIVGPRPPLPREVDEYETADLIRLKGKPGITGLWQVSGRSELSFDDMVSLDRRYLENWSIGMDLGIMARTAAAVFAHRGAY